MADESPGKSEAESRAAPAVLLGWKQIARYLSKSIRTVQRWEHDLGLPVRKIDTQTKSDVVAFVTEIEVWVRRGSLPINESGALPCTTSPSPHFVVHDAQRLQRAECLHPSRRDWGVGGTR
jgi:hypothetical protein